MASIKEQLRKKFDQKKILILGFGKEGRSTYELLKTSCNGDLYIMDQNTEVAGDYIASKKDTHTKVLAKEDYLKNLDAFDLIFKTPGLPGYLLKDIKTEKISSQSQLFMEFLGDRCIGITGTKGKSTTSAIIAHVLEQAGVSVRLVGNIGFPSLESLLDDDGQTLYAYEMSSFQTEFLRTGPRIGVILNLFQEHLNNYEGYNDYQESKLQLFKAHVEHAGEQVLIYGCDNPVLLEKIKDLRSDNEERNFWTFGQSHKNSLSDPGYFIEDDKIVRIDESGKTFISTTDFSRKILGIHNLLNSLVAFIVIESLAKQGMIEPMDYETIIKSLSSFRGLPHRLEEVGIFKGITFYNDSISTIPEAAIKAMEAIHHLGTLIIGGFDRKIGYHYFARYLDQVDDINIICLPETGHQIYDMMNKTDHCFKVEDMVEAVEKAYDLTPSGKACLLSPAASSYNQYKNFEERGDHFVECVRKGQKG